MWIFFHNLFIVLDFSNRFIIIKYFFFIFFYNNNYFIKNYFFFNNKFFKICFLYIFYNFN
ncbi:MAG: hypothetical protein CMJ17_09830 [Phenylobacterium sp.]|nr:hypothetical protein [Phenylobacterium sp.]